jgi:hypothetical protein
MPPRCCQSIPGEFQPSYASVLVYGPDPANLSKAVEELETKQGLTSCFTAWCACCKRNYMLTGDLCDFPAPSAFHTHQLALLKVLRESGAMSFQDT